MSEPPAASGIFIVSAGVLCVAQKGLLLWGRGLSIQSGGWRRRLRHHCLCTVANTIAEVDQKTCNVTETCITFHRCLVESGYSVCLCWSKIPSTQGHPNGKAHPGSLVELHHQIDVDEQTSNWKKGEQGNLGRKSVCDGTLISRKDTFKTHSSRESHQQYQHWLTAISSLFLEPCALLTASCVPKHRLISYAQRRTAHTASLRVSTLM